MTENVLPFPTGSPSGEADEPAAVEVDLGVIAALEAALAQALAGEISAFMMVFERPDRSTDTLYETTGSRDLKGLLGELVLEQARLTRYLIDAEEPPPGAA